MPETRPPVTHAIALYYGFNGVMLALTVPWSFADWIARHPGQSWLGQTPSLLLGIISAFSFWNGAMTIWRRDVRGIWWIAMGVAINAHKTLTAAYVSTTSIVFLGLSIAVLFVAWLELKDDTTETMSED